MLIILNRRHDAVEYLAEAENYSLREAMRHSFSLLPDLERSFARICSTRVRISELCAFLSALENLQAFVETATSLVPKTCSTALIRKLIHNFPSLTDLLRQLSFNRTRAVEDNFITPPDGIVPAFDEAQGRVRALEGEIDEYIAAQGKAHKCFIKRASFKTERVMMVTAKGALRRPPSEFMALKGTAVWHPQSCEHIFAHCCRVKIASSRPSCADFQARWPTLRVS